VKRTAFWRSDWFLGLAVGLLVLTAGRSDTMEALERAVYDAGMRLADATPSDRIAVIAIDDASLANLGRWPWPRDVHARMIDRLAAAGAKTIGYMPFFFDPQIDPGLADINRLLEFYDHSTLAGLGSLTAPATDTAADPAAAQPPDALVQRAADDSAKLGEMLHESQARLNTDAQLADAIRRAGNVVLSMSFVLGSPGGNPDHPMPAWASRFALTTMRDDVDALQRNLLPYPSQAALLPIPALGEAAAGIGHLNANLDRDGGRRTEPLVVRYFENLEFYPSFSLALAAHSLNLAPGDVTVRLGQGVDVGRISITTDELLNMFTFYYHDRAGQKAIPVDSFFDVYTGKIDPAKYRGRIVLVGPTATGVSTPQVTPVDPAMAPVLAVAHNVSSILNRNFFTLPEWTLWARYGAIVLVVLYLVVVLPRLRAARAAALSLALLVALLGGELFLLDSRFLWLPLVLPAVMLVGGHLLLTTKRFLVTERGKVQSDASSAESNRMLGLAFQNQGQLDMAFEKLRKVPLDDSLMDVLYNLALDFERKRFFGKANAVYQYMSEHDPKFRDVGGRMKRNQAMEETVILGSRTSRGGTGTIVLDREGVQKPMLGRYQVEKEIGKGAMGVVYLGRDPKINRVVAIKTMALSEEFEADELDEVKARFFREAETAGRLSHPNIVTIYDAGEEQDLAYIAMEFLTGRELTPWTKADNLLPLPAALSVVTQVADALAYAHQHNVVHRDIKPANVMYEQEAGRVKVTDFGIARITDASRTKTGVVLGTPSYMSPEQLIGHKVDGRSDLFSLGVMFYQLVTGRLPFGGDSLATLAYRIANEPHADVLRLRPDLPPCVSAIINKALEKNVEKRYQSAAEMVGYLRTCAGQIR